MYRKCRNTITLLLLLLSVIFISGCWSKNEIDDINLYLGIALDKADKQSEISDNSENDFPNKHLVTATIQVATNSSSNASSKHYINYSQSGDSIIEILREFGSRLNKPVIAHHLKLVIISKDLIESQHMNNFIDFMVKDNDIRPNCLVFITEGRASDVLSFNNSTTIPSLYVQELVQNQKRTNRLFPRNTITRVNTMLHQKQSFILQNIVSTEDEIKFSGGEIIKGNTGDVIGKILEQDISSINWINNNINGGIIKSYNQNDKVIAYEIESAKSVVHSYVEHEQVKFHIKIETMGRLIENWDRQFYASDQAYIDETKTIFKETLHKQLVQLTTKLQKEYQADVIGLGKIVKNQHPALWRELRNNWDDTFSKSSIEFDISLDISDYGASSQ